MRKAMAVAVLSVLGTLGAGAQETPPLVGVSVFKVAPEQVDAWVEAAKAGVVPALAKLKSEGTVLSYGIDVDILHRGGEPNVTAWFAVPSYEAYQKVDTAVSQAFAEHPEQAQAMMEGTDFDLHTDLILRPQEGAGELAPAGTMPYTIVSRMKAYPGYENEFLEGFRKYSKPLLDKLVADGAIYEYGLYAAEMHADDPSYRWLAATMPDLSGLDKAVAAMAKMNAARSPEERSAIEESMQRTSDASAHRDYISRAEVYSGP